MYIRMPSACYAADLGSNPAVGGNLFSTFREPLVNRKDLRALTLVGPPRDNPEQDPLAVLHLHNRLCMLRAHTTHSL